MKDPNTQVRLHVADALGLINNKKGLPALIAGVKDPVNEVRRVAARALGRFQAEQATAALLDALKDRDAIVRENALESLCNQGELTTQAMVPLLADPYPNIAEKAIRHLPKDPGLIPALLKAMQRDDGHQSIRAIAALKLHELGRPEGMNCLLNMLKSSDQQAQLHAIGELGISDDKRAAGPLIDLLERTKESDIREEIVGALGRIGDKRAIPTIRKLLHTEKSDSSLYKAAIGVLYEFGEIKEDFPSLPAEYPTTGPTQR
jgi:HEAT repeat protein